MKYPNARIESNNSGETYYCSLYPLNDGIQNVYLTSAGEELNWQTSEISIPERTKLVYFPTKELAQQALDAFNNMNKTRNYAALKQEGIDKNLRPGYVYLGEGDSANPLSNDWNKNDIYHIKSKNNIDKTRWSGDSSGRGYCTSENIWNKKFPQEKKQITLNEIKSQLLEAKKLIGKKVKRLAGRNSGDIYGVEDAILHLENPPRGPLHDKFFEENGYVISLTDKGSNTVFQVGTFEVIEEIVVENHSGESYTAKNKGDFWVFGCARIDKSLIKRAYELLDDKATTKGNRSATKVTIGAADFDLETLKKLVEAS